MWPFSKEKRKGPGAPIFLTNTLSGDKERFSPLKAGKVLQYSCGPTVYGPQHIGNLRAAVFSDTLARTLTLGGYKVRRVVNITDVGHMVGDGDEGEDKMQVGAKRENVRPEEIAERYTKQYLGDIKALNINTDSILFPRATEYIKEQIAMIDALEKKGLAYRAEDGVYFDTKKFPDYGKLGGIMDVKLMAGARVKMISGKRNIHDFALWRFAKKGDLQVWGSPWGPGNPGWSIECSAMARALLGETIDIHTGGEDHVGVHHNNEIAQSEGANGRPLARYWLHNAFLTIEGEKVSKSLGNIYVLADITAKGFDPLALRYFFMQAHYRSSLSFSFEALQASAEGLTRLQRSAAQIQKRAGGRESESDVRQKIDTLLKDDLGTPKALACLWEALGSDELTDREKWGAIVTADAVLGLSLGFSENTLSLSELPEDLQTLAQEREQARKAKDFARSDELRIHLSNRGYHVEDTPSGPLFSKSTK